ncbi:MAG: 4'-phosphopantetheinyl transferase superfamily protein, partial [Arenimonas sp.]
EMASRNYKNAIEDWTYFQDADDQRRLKCKQAGLPEFYISISHSGNKIAAAISLRPIGIDLETYNKQRDFVAIANHVFSVSEAAYLKNCKLEDLKPTFYLYWTLKESIAKQHGEGLKFEVSRTQSPIQVSDTEYAAMQSWQCSDFVLSVACNDASEIVVDGICIDALRRRWKNIPSNSR